MSDKGFEHKVFGSWLVHDTTTRAEDGPRVWGCSGQLRSWAALMLVGLSGLSYDWSTWAPCHSGGGSAQTPGGSTRQGCLRCCGHVAGMCWTQGAPPSWCYKPLGLHTFPEASTRELGPAVPVAAALIFHFREHLKELETVWEGDGSEILPPE